ncbi:alpha/beta hydrolase [Jannaschia pagri]|uniref:Alpha/beta hydrolase n=1 Tax=Jannaschia pagri TaxID=2829797 RepID=A0ABQ4NNE5_9RHOB|nr:MULTISPECIES: alpha/beta hydrolase [unclassified Jannaschia]GIT91941.1 alpha/beta hydrolase [Jannaschia sp. AI_61]GIT95775.1 alpha/beta hydrolase [Jannaschia sp. AI_62]
MAQTITRNGVDLAFHHTPGTGPLVVFLGGFKSDMDGTKAVALEAWAKAKGQAFLRLDYGGHGLSGGAFEDGSIGDWRDDALAVIDHVTTGPLVLVGSSMGGWISLLVTRDRPDQVKGLVTIAAAPDFTEDGFWASFDEAQRQTLMETGQVAVPSDYGAPYIITRRLIEEGRKTLVLRQALSLPCPTRFLQGTADADVSVETALRLLDHAEGPDMRLTLVDGADHRFSDEDCLRLIERSVTEVLEAAGT